MKENDNNNNNKILKDFPPSPPHFSISSFTCSLPVFAHTYLGYSDYASCYMPFVFKSYCLFGVTCNISGSFTRLISAVRLLIVFL